MFVMCIGSVCSELVGHVGDDCCLWSALVGISTLPVP